MADESTSTNTAATSCKGPCVCIIGGVAGGASCAARLRRLSEDAHIILFDKGPFVSFANCGLPYYVGNVIKQERALIVASAHTFRDRFNIDVRTKHEVLSIDRASKSIAVKNLDTDQVYSVTYDKLVLAPGARPIRPPLPGINDPAVFVLRTIPDSKHLREYIEKHSVQRVVIVGGGFIGVEMAENLANRELDVTLIERNEQLMPSLDKELTVLLGQRMRDHKINILLAEGVTGFFRVPAADGVDEHVIVRTDKNREIRCEMIVLSIGVIPDCDLAERAGLALGGRKAIKVNEHMQTSDPDIYSVGDVVETVDFVSGQPTTIPLAGPASRQGRVAAENIVGRTTTFRGVQGTAVCGAFGLTLASTGLSEKAAQRVPGLKFASIYLHPGHHAGYFPGSKKIHMKLVFDRTDGKVLGAQAIGEEGVEKRIDVIAMAMQMKATVFDLQEAELCYAPQYGAARDPVNVAGMIAANVLLGDSGLTDIHDLDRTEGIRLDVRDPQEFEAGHIPGAINIPLDEIRRRYPELSHDSPILVYCAEGRRAYFAIRVLVQHGYDARNISGGYVSYKMLTDSLHR